MGINEIDYTIHPYTVGLLGSIPKLNIASALNVPFPA